MSNAKSKALKGTPASETPASEEAPVAIEAQVEASTPASEEAPVAPEASETPAPVAKVTPAEALALKVALATAAADAAFRTPSDAAATLAATEALKALPMGEALATLATCYGDAVANLTADPAALADPEILATLQALAPLKATVEASVRAKGKAPKAPSDPVPAALALGRRSLALQLASLASEGQAREAFGNLTPGQGASVLEALAADVAALTDEASVEAFMKGHGASKAPKAPGQPRGASTPGEGVETDRDFTEYRWQGGAADGASVTRGTEGWSFTTSEGRTEGPFKSANKLGLALTGANSLNCWEHLRSLRGEALASVASEAAAE